MRSHKQGAKHLVFIINVDWYFLLHWKDRLVHALAHGYHVTVITNVTSDAIYNEMRELEVDVIPVDIRRHSINVLRDLANVVRLKNIVKSLSPDAVHAITIKPICYCLLVGRWWSTGFVFSFPGLGAFANTKSFVVRSFWSFFRRFKSLLGRNAKAIYTFENSSDMSLVGIVDDINQRALTISGAGVDLSIYKPMLTSSLSEKIKVLFAARLLREKGLEVLYVVVSRMVSNGVPVELHIAGIEDNDHRDALCAESIDKIRSSDFVIWHGHVHDMERLMPQCDVFCLPTSYGEGMPRTLIEAAACELPIVASAIAGCCSIVVDGENGFLVPVGDEARLESSLKTLINSKELCQKFGKAGRARVRQYFSTEIVVRENVELYREVI